MRFSGLLLLAWALAMSGGCVKHTTVEQATPTAPPEDPQIRVLRQRLNADPNNLDLRLALAGRYRSVGMPELALNHYRLACDRFPTDPRPVQLRAELCHTYGYDEEAMAVLVNFCNRNPKSSTGLLSLEGIIEDDAGQFEAAEKSYRAAIAESPARADLRNNLGYNLLLQDKPKEAIAEFEEALKIDPHSNIANNNLALALLAQWKDDSQPKEALLHWQAVSDPASAHNNLAAYLIEQKRYKEARAELEVALSYRRDHAEALANLKLVAKFDGGPSTPPSRSELKKRAKTVGTAQHIVTAEPNGGAAATISK